MKFDIKKLLIEREKTHGSFENTSQVYASLLEAYNIGSSKFQKKLSPSQITSLHLILFKLARIRVNPANKDSWIDTSGYASLACEDMETKK